MDPRPAKTSIDDDLSGGAPPAGPPAEPSPARSSWKKWVFLACVALLVTVFDQWSKRWAFDRLHQRGAGAVSLLEGKRLAFRFTFVRNPGAAWGMLANTSESFRRPFFFVVSVLAMIFVIYLFARLTAGQRLLMTALALVMGGAIGNFIDRVMWSYVIDFIDLRFWSLRWPTFNIADVAISCGVLLLGLEMIIAAVQQRPRRAS